MARLFDDNRQVSIYSQETADSIYSGAMTRLYGWVAMGGGNHRGSGLDFRRRRAP